MTDSATPPSYTDSVFPKLKEFQRDTAKYAFQRMFEEDDYTTRFLVADEVGLGKTWVAKGVVAQVLDHLRSIEDESHDIVYICSNRAIASQNIAKLLPEGVVAKMPKKPPDRLSMLLHPDHQMEQGTDGRKIKLIALTPKTSFKRTRGAGRREERALAVALLKEVWGHDSFKHQRARRIFWGNIEIWNDPDGRLQEESDRIRSKLNPRAVKAFREAKPEALRAEFNQLVEMMPSRSNITVSAPAKESQRKFLRAVFETMACAGLGLLQPDLVIMDEFQRFKELLQPKSDEESVATDLAQTLFNIRDEEKAARDQQVRCLLLSATPYKSYTTADEADGSEDHYADFISTCRFLFSEDAKPADEQPKTAETESLLTKLRRSLRAVGDAASSGSGPARFEAVQAAIDKAQETCDALSCLLRSVISRTERLAASEDRAGMLRPLVEYGEIASDDVEAYLHFADLATQHAEHHDPVEYWKSGPYSLSFMSDKDYKKLKGNLVKGLEKGDIKRKEFHGPAVLRWNELDRYRSIAERNGRFRWLARDLGERSAFDLLWMPPSLPYYNADSVYEDAATNPSLTKRLIFSNWSVVPRAVSAMLSYEAERRNMNSGKSRYFDPYRKRGGQRLSFRMRGGKPASRTSLLFMWPSPTLAKLGDPRQLRGETDPPPSLDKLRVVVQQRIKNSLSAHGLVESSSEGREDERWYWAAPVMLDWINSPDKFCDWWYHSGFYAARDVRRPTDGDDAEERTLAEAERHERNLKRHEDWVWRWVVTEMARSGRGQANEAVRRALRGPDEALNARRIDDWMAAQCIDEWMEPRNPVKYSPLGRMPGDLEAVLTELAVGGPAICALRALSSVYGGDLDDPDVLSASAEIANAFRHFFNEPEVTALVDRRDAAHARRTEDAHEDAYWRSAVRHCVEGNLQAVLDEQMHLLRDEPGHSSRSPAEPPVEVRANNGGVEAAEAKVANKLAASLSLGTSSSSVDFPPQPNSPREMHSKKMRNKIAVPFGARHTEESGHERDKRVRAAFNSPFWPFVLTSTSVGQEGLDFHLWCHAVVHWNLPTNPVDLEQREGRVHRYKNHAVRRNLAKALGAQALREAKPGEDVWEKLFELGEKERAASANKVDAQNEMVPYWVYPGSVAREDGAAADDEGEKWAKIERLVPLLPFSREVSLLADLKSKLGAYRLAIGQPRQEELLAYLDRSGVLRSEELKKELAKLRIDLTPPSRNGQAVKCDSPSIDATSPDRAEEASRAGA